MMQVLIREGGVVCHVIFRGDRPWFTGQKLLDKPNWTRDDSGPRKSHHLCSGISFWALNHRPEHGLLAWRHPKKNQENKQPHHCQYSIFTIIFFFSLSPYLAFAASFLILLPSPPPAIDLGHGCPLPSTSPLECVHFPNALSPPSDTWSGDCLQSGPARTSRYPLILPKLARI